VDCGEVGRFVLVRVMTEMLKCLFEINFNFVECFDGFNPARDMSNQLILNLEFPTHLGGCGGPRLTVSAVAMMFRIN
jgi:hypothetical protein